MVLEGGSIDVNGAGLLLTTEECLLSEVQQRNPGMTRREIERHFRDYLGIESTIWLANGIAGDDTHGHVDDLARFVSADTVVVASETDRSDANYAPLRENHALLRAAGLNVVKLPMPRPLVFACLLYTSHLAPNWLQESWASSERAGLDRLSTDEIDAEIAAARKARHEVRSQPGS